MKTIKWTLTLMAFFGIGNSLQAQDSASIFSGMQESLNHHASTISEITGEANRLFMLFKGDIRLYMSSHDEGNFYDLSPTKQNSGLFYNRGRSDASIYAQLDWDNKAMSMHVKNSKYMEGIGVAGTGGGFGKSHSTDHYQFTDKHGNWYVPMELESGGIIYIKVEAKQYAIEAFKGLHDLSIDLAAADGVQWLLGAAKNIDWKKLEDSGYDLKKSGLQDISTTILEGREINAQLQKELKEVLKLLLNKQYSDIAGFPIFIHWAFLYSPKLIKSKYDVTENSFDCYGLPNACTELKVKSGKEKGKSMIFDQHNRLVFINAKKEGTALFLYDKDVSVTLPPSATMRDIIAGRVVLKN